jgi:hypothetical protein
MPVVNNGDGLSLKLGVVEGQSGRAGEYNTFGPQTVYEFAINLADLTSASAILDYNTTFDKGLLIEKVEVQTVVAVTGTNAALNLGLIRLDDTTTYDVDGLGKAAALTQTAMADVGNVLTYVDGTSNAGDFVGTILANAGRLVGDYDTAAFTAGRVVVRVYASKPL